MAANPSAVKDALSSLVEAVVTRLRESRLDRAPLIEEWDAIRRIDDEEAEFCVATARLGLDPLSLSDEQADVVIDVSNELAGRLLEDFLESASSDSIASDLAWVRSSRGIAQDSQLTTERLPELKPDDPPLQQSWRLGQQNAVQFRSALKVDSDERIDLAPYVAHLEADHQPRSIDALGAINTRSGHMLASGHHKTDQARRFTEARAVWRFARGETEFLVSAARTALQRAERAFAAELLAPASGIRGFIEPTAENEGLVGIDDVRAISDHFGVNEWVVEYQIENQLGLRVDDPFLDRA